MAERSPVTDHRLCNSSLEYAATMQPFLAKGECDEGKAKSRVDRRTSEDQVASSRRAGL
jgi:hypothetical protein